MNNLGADVSALVDADPIPPSRLQRVRDTLGRHPTVVRAIVVTAVWELVTELVGWAAALMIPPDKSDVAAFIHATGPFKGQHLFRFETIWVRWDGIWYSLIGSHGYGPHTSILNAFFPAYPLLIHVVGIVLGGQYVLAAVLINRLLLFPTVIIFMKLVERPGRRDPREMELAPVLFLLIPGTVFFLAALSEMLFVFACLACLLAMREGRYVLAGLACALATATRLPGVVLLAAMALEFLLQRKPWQAVRASAIGVMGIGSYAIFTLITQHDAFAFRNAYANGQWNDQHNTLNIFAGPLTYFRYMLKDPLYHDYGGVVTFTYLAALVAVVVLLAVAWRHLRWSHRLFSIGTAVIPLLSGSLFSYYRYSIVPLLPIMIVACRWLARRPTWRDATLLCLAGLAFFGIIGFAGSHWIS
jgi:hypothetical protein